MKGVSANRIRPILWIVASWVVVSATDATAQPDFDYTIPTLSQSQVERLNRQEILVEMLPGDMFAGKVMGVVAAPPDQVLAVIADFDRWSEFIPNLSRTEIVGREDDFVLFHGVTDTPWPVDDREWTVRAWQGPIQVDGVDVLVSTWDYIPDSGNIDETEGYWLMIPWGQHDGAATLVVYDLTFDMGSWIPDSLLNWGSENLLPGMIEGLRTQF